METAKSVLGFYINLSQEEKEIFERNYAEIQAAQKHQKEFYENIKRP